MNEPLFHVCANCYYTWGQTLDVVYTRCPVCGSPNIWNNIPNNEGETRDGAKSDSRTTGNN